MFIRQKTPLTSNEHKNIYSTIRNAQTKKINVERIRFAKQTKKLVNRVEIVYTQIKGDFRSKCEF